MFLLSNFETCIFKKSLFVFCLLFVISELQAGALHSYKKLASYKAEELNKYWRSNNIPKIIINANNDVDVYEVEYCSPFLNRGNLATSGLVFVPSSVLQNLPVISYSHGTEIIKERMIKLNGETGICVGYAADGYMVCSPDYFGMAQSEGTHLYLNVETEGQCGYDLLLASQELLKELGGSTNGQLFITGYSQGGHAAVSLLKKVQEKPIDGLSLVASSPMSAPYDLKAAVDESKYRNYTYPSFLMMLLHSYHFFTHFNNDISSYLKEPYSQTVPPLMDGKHTLEDLNAVLPNTPFGSLNEYTKRLFDSIPNSDLNRYLVENSLHNLDVKTPIQLCFCNGDNIVKKDNSFRFYNSLISKGKKDVFLKQSGSKFGHYKCAYFTIVYTKMFFDKYRKDKIVKGNFSTKKVALNLGKLFISKKE